MDSWKQHVSLEISDSLGDEERLLTITNALMGMEYADLIPDDISSYLFNQIQSTNERG